MVQKLIVFETLVCVILSYLPRKSALLKPLLNLPVGLDLGKSMPLKGKSALAWLSGMKALVPTSAVESPSMKREGTVAPDKQGTKMARKIDEATYLFSMREWRMLSSLLPMQVFFFGYILECLICVHTNFTSTSQEFIDLICNEVSLRT